MGNSVNQTPVHYRYLPVRHHLESIKRFGLRFTRSCWKTSSSGLPRYLSIRTIISPLGSNFPCSSFVIYERATPTRRARCALLTPFASRHFATRFVIIMVSTAPTVSCAAYQATIICLIGAFCVDCQGAATIFGNNDNTRTNRGPRPVCPVAASINRHAGHDPPGIRTPNEPFDSVPLALAQQATRPAKRSNHRQDGKNAEHRAWCSL